MKVLVVEDVGFVRKIIQDFLLEHEYSAVAAECAEDAFELLKADHTIRVVLTDLYLPGMNGFELFSKTQKVSRVTDEGTVPPPEFILMTASDPLSNAPGLTGSVLDYAMCVGFLEVLSKPPDREKLLSLLEAAQERDAQEDRSQSETDADSKNCPDSVKLLKALRATVSIFIGTGEVEDLRLLHKELANSVSRVEASLEMFVGEPEPVESTN